MRFAAIISVAALFALTPEMRGTESPFVTELNRIATERDKALAAAAAPINKKFKAALETLLQRATKAGNLDSALKIRNALEELTKSQVGTIDPATVKTRRALQKALIGTNWTMGKTREDAASSKFIIKFVSESELQFPDNTSAWDALDGRTVKFGEATVVFDASLQSYQCVDWYGDGPRYGVRKGG